MNAILKQYVHLSSKLTNLPVECRLTCLKACYIFERLFMWPGLRRNAIYAMMDQ